MPIKLNADISAGDTFRSPRESEGVVTAVCDFGACRHNDDRPDSVHVRGSYKSRLFQTWDTTEFFIALPTSIPSIDTTEVL